MTRAQAYGFECRHHYGITTHEFAGSEFVAATVYGLTRGWHPEALTGDNHTWKYEAPGEGVGAWARIVITKNELSPPFALKPWWVDDGPGARWFSQEFRLADREVISAEIAEALTMRDRCLADAARQRDTVRGRKASEKYRSLAMANDLRTAQIAQRWPQFIGAT